MVSARVNFALPGGAAGIVFGWENEDNFYELRVVDGRDNAAQGVDVRFVRRSGGTETTLIEVADKVNVGSTNNQPPVEAGWFTTALPARVTQAVPHAR